MFTIDTFLEIADRASMLYVERKALVDSRVYDPEREVAERLYHEAMQAALHMEEKTIKEAVAVGPFTRYRYVPGANATIAKGATMHSADPRHGGVAFRVADPFEVEVVHFTEGYIDEDDGTIANPTIAWVGKRGFWFWVDINEVHHKTG